MDETRSLSPDGSLRIQLISGGLRIVGWDRSELKITGTLGDEVEELEISGGAKDLEIEVVPVKGTHKFRGDGTSLEIRIPSSCELEVESVSGGVSTDRIQGRLSIEAVSGRIDVDGAGDNVTLSVVSGELVFRSDRPVKRGEFQTVSGNMDLTLSLAPEARISVEAFSGDVDLRIPDNTSATFEVSTFSGDIDNEFAKGRVEKSSMLPAKSLEFTLGSGGARAEVESFSGEVRIRRATH